MPTRKRPVPDIVAGLCEAGVFSNRAHRARLQLTNLRPSSRTVDATAIRKVRYPTSSYCGSSPDSTRFHAFQILKVFQMVRHGLTVALLLVMACRADEESGPQFGDESAAFLKKWCAECHSGGKAQAGFRVDQTFSTTDLLKQRKAWLHALNRMASDEMPPQRQATTVNRTGQWVYEAGYLYLRPPRPKRET